MAKNILLWLDSNGGYILSVKTGLSLTFYLSAVDG